MAKNRCKHSREFPPIFAILLSSSAIRAQRKFFSLRLTRFNFFWHHRTGKEEDQKRAKKFLRDVNSRDDGGSWRAEKKDLRTHCNFHPPPCLSPPNQSSNTYVVHTTFFQISYLRSYFLCHVTTFKLYTSSSLSTIAMLTRPSPTRDHMLWIHGPLKESFFFLFFFCKLVVLLKNKGVYTQNVSSYEPTVRLQKYALYMRKKDTFGGDDNTATFFLLQNTSRCLYLAVLSPPASFLHPFSFQVFFCAWSVDDRGIPEQLHHFFLHKRDEEREREREGCCYCPSFPLTPPSHHQNQCISLGGQIFTL